MSRSKDEKERRIAAIPLFAAAGRKTMKHLVEAVEEVHIPSGTTMIHEGGFPGDFSVIVEGGATVEANGEQVATLGPSDVVGELAFLARAPASATVTTTADCELLSIRHSRLEQILEGDPDFVRQLAEILARRLLERNRAG